MKLDYQVVYSKRKTLSLIVERDRSIMARAPLETSEQSIHKAVESKKLRLYEKTRHPHKYPLTYTRKEFVSSDNTVPFLWRYYRLEVSPNDVRGAQFHSRFIIPRENQTYAQKIFKAWYVERISLTAPHILRRRSACASTISPSRVCPYAGLAYPTI